MKPIEHILAPIDFSEGGRPALDTAIALARQLQAKLTLLHVCYVPPSYSYGDGLLWPIEGIRREAEAELSRATAGVREKVPAVESQLAIGDPPTEIVEAAKDGVDLVIVGTHGRRGLSRLLLGSVADKVVRLCPVPVLTVPATWDEAGAPGGRSQP